MMWDEYRRAMDELPISPDFERETEAQMRVALRPRQSKERSAMKKRTMGKAVAAVAATFAFTATAYAAVGMLSPADVAQEMKMPELAQAFDEQGEQAAAETQRLGDYDVTLLGVTSGDRLSDWSKEVDAGSTYAVVSVTRADGEPIDTLEAYGVEPVSNSDEIQVGFEQDEDAELSVAEEDESLVGIYSMTPLVSGYEPWQVNGWTLGAVQTSFNHEGAVYYLLETANLEPFADRDVYLAFYKGGAPNAETFAIADDGGISLTKETDGILFKLPLDAAKADPAKAAELLQG